MRFKTFLLESSSTETIAKAIVAGGFKNNLLAMHAGNRRLFRGNKRYTNFFEANADNLIYIEPARTVDRKSTYSDLQFSANAWHAFGGPPRSRCVMASPSKALADNFSDDTAYGIVPKDGTMLYGIKEDWNLSFLDQINLTFGTEEGLKLGALPTLLDVIFRGLSRNVELTEVLKSKKPASAGYAHPAVTNFVTKNKGLYDKINKTIDYNKADLKKFFDAFDKLLRTTEEGGHYVIDHSTLHLISNNSWVTDFMGRLSSMVQDGASSFKLFEELFKDCFKEVQNSTDPVKLINLLDKSNKAEIWWTSDSLILSEKFFADKLKEVVELIKGL